MIDSNKKSDSGCKRYTLATRDVDIVSMTVTGIFVVAMAVCACLLDDKRYLFIPLFFAVVTAVGFVSLLIRYLTEPKIAISADGNGIYFHYRRGKEVFIDYADIIGVSNKGLRNIYGRIAIATHAGEYRSIRTKELGDKLTSLIERLRNTDDKIKFLAENTLRNNSK